VGVEVLPPFLRGIDAALVVAAGDQQAHDVDAAVLDHEQRQCGGDADQQAPGEADGSDGDKDEEDDEVFAERQARIGAHQPLGEQAAARPHQHRAQQRRRDHIEQHVTEDERRQRHRGHREADDAAPAAEAVAEEGQRHGMEAGNATDDTGQQIGDADGAQLVVEVDIALGVEFDGGRVHQHGGDREHDAEGR